MAHVITGDENAFESRALELRCLAAICRYPNIYNDIETKCNREFFSSKLNRKVFDELKHSYVKKIKLTGETLATKMRAMGIIKYGEIKIDQFCEDLFLSVPVSYQGALHCFDELKILHTKKQIAESAEKVITYLNKSGRDGIDQIIAKSDQIYYETINRYDPDDEPVDLYGHMEQLIYDRAENPVEHIGLEVPFPVFEEKFGTIRSGNGVYCIVSRPKAGKSTWLLNMAEGITARNENCVALYLDTEMTTDVSAFRLASGLTTVPFWYLDHGQWQGNADYTDQIQEKLSLFQERKGKIFHLKVANKPVEEICSVIRRWHHRLKSYEGNENLKLLVVYDYIKITGERLSQFNQEYQAIGTKIDKLNELGGQLDIPIWVAMQSNRTAEGGNDDSSVVALSDRLQWFCAFNAIFRQKTAEEIAVDGPQYGTHKLIPLATRFQGRDAMGHNPFVNVSPDGERPRYERFYINYNVDNFHIREMGTIHDVIRERNEAIEAMQPQADQPEQAMHL